MATRDIRVIDLLVRDTPHTQHSSSGISRPRALYCVCVVSRTKRSITNYIESIYILVEPSSFVRKLLPQHVCDGRETRPYFRAPHGECHKGVGGRQFVTAKKSAAQIPTLTEIDAMFFVRLRMANAILDTLIVVCKKAVQWPRGDAHALWHAKAPRGTIVHK